MSIYDRAKRKVGQSLLVGKTGITGFLLFSRARRKIILMNEDGSLCKWAGHLWEKQKNTPELVAKNARRVEDTMQALFMRRYTPLAYQKLCLLVLECSLNVTGMCPSAAQFTAQFFKFINYWHQHVSGFSYDADRRPTEGQTCSSIASFIANRLGLACFFARP